MLLLCWEIVAAVYVAARRIIRSDESLAVRGCLGRSHVILQQNLFDSVQAADEDELDMLDQAPCTQATSRLGCQLKVTEGYDGSTITIPSEFRNMLVPHIPTSSQHPRSLKDSPLRARKEWCAERVAWVLRVDAGEAASVGV